METIEAIKQSGVAPNEFWYLSTLILTGILVLFIAILTFFVKSFFTELKETIKDLKENIEQLTTLVKIHDVKIDNLEKRRR